jgi:ketosteroid isomerase-like protein
MSDRDNIELVKGVYSAFAQGDIQAVLGLFADDLDFQHPMPHSIWPWAGRRSARQGFAEFLAGLSETLEYERLEPHEFIAQNDWVVVILFERSRIKATGVVYEISLVHVFKLRNGKVVQVMVFEDTAPIIAALHGYRK